ncbi:cyclin-dependent kinase 2-associated protein 2-like, partial [Trachypithecus francoisi]|uniref:cyclin-dependent kinase 2-associated protein 2-like n=1 Tax=Trachypithecus francoisi TaxID=54180 RepID=UPI00141B826B
FTPCSSTPGPCTPVPTSVPSPSGSKSGAAAPFRPLFNDFGPPSMGFVQEMKSPAPRAPRTPYKDLLSVIEEISKEIRPIYAGSKSTMKGLKRGIIHARALVGVRLAETEWSVRTKQEAPRPQGLDLSWPLQSTRFSLAALAILDFLSCVPWWVPSRNQGAALTRGGSTNYAPQKQELAARSQ